LFGVVHPRGRCGASLRRDGQMPRSVSSDVRIDLPASSSAPAAAAALIPPACITREFLDVACLRRRTFAPPEHLPRIHAPHHSPKNYLRGLLVRGGI